MRLSFFLDIRYAQVLPIRLGGVLIGYFGGMIFTKFLFLDMHLYRCILHVRRLIGANHGYECNSHTRRDHSSN